MTFVCMCLLYLLQGFKTALGLARDNDHNAVATYLEEELATKVLHSCSTYFLVDLMSCNFVKLCNAAMKGNFVEVMNLVQWGADIHFRDEVCYNTLYI